jgi:hypothetical protein
MRILNTGPVIEVMFFRGGSKHRGCVPRLDDNNDEALAPLGVAIITRICVITCVSASARRPEARSPNRGDPLDIAHFGRNFCLKRGVAPPIPNF